MTTTAVLGEDTKTIIQDEASRFEWGAVLAGAIIGTALTFFLVSLGSGLGLSLVSVHGATTSGAKGILTGGAIYFLAANAFGFAVAGHVVGRMMRGTFEGSEEEHFRTDTHALAAWGLGVMFGAAVLALTAGPTISAGAASRTNATPVNYWVDKLFRPASPQQAALSFQRYAQNQASPSQGNDAQQNLPPAGEGANPGQMPAGQNSMPLNRTLGDIKAEAGRLLTAVAANTAEGGDKERLITLVSQAMGMAPAEARNREQAVESDMTAKIKQAADTARKAVSYISIWTALALLFSAVVCVVAALFARAPSENERTRG
jgi:hypothetical protein